jgi:hypothetical protein|tara:strand:- start:731 stop:1087 length:357 start_codon:yes stop_codon:yes gene_type:complete
MSLRKIIGKITSPIFVPLRKIVAWGDQNFGTCNATLVVVDRDSDYTPEDSNIMRNIGNFILTAGCYVFTMLALFTTAVLFLAAFNQLEDADLLMLSVSASLNATLALMCFRTHNIINK